VIGDRRWKSKKLSKLTASRSQINKRKSKIPRPIPGIVNPEAEQIAAPGGFPYRTMFHKLMRGNTLAWILL
jgi:hypothetical protein